jgi:hypothetical protein
MGDISGIILTILMSFIIIFSDNLKKDPASFKIVTLGFATHIIIAIYNGYVGPTIGAGSDAIAFFNQGKMIAETGDIQFKLGSDSYRNILGGLFYLFEPSLYLACVLSVAAYLASIFPLISICKALKYEKFQPHILAAYSFLPSMFLFGSIALRESAQVCFCIFAVKYFIQFYSHKNIKYYFYALFFSFLMGMLHFGLLLFAGLMTLIVTLMNYNHSKNAYLFIKSKSYTYILLITFIGIVLLSLPSLNSFGIVTLVLQGDNLTEYTETYRSNLDNLNPRSGYELELDYSSPFSLIFSAFKMLFYYIAYPFPWNISAIIDIYACLEALWRCTLIYYSFKGWFIASGEVKKVLSLLIILYFSLASIWAMGTTNFGTGMRHNLTHYWILTITGLPYLILSLRSFLNKYLFKNGSYL